jgi:hypothetical protein
LLYIDIILVVASLSLQLFRRDVLVPLSRPDRKFIWLIRSHFTGNAIALPKVLASMPSNAPIKHMTEVCQYSVHHRLIM